MNVGCKSVFYKLKQAILLLCFFCAGTNALHAQSLVKEWDKRFGGSNTDHLRSIQQTTDGGYILAGHSLSGISGDKTEASQLFDDYWVVKVSSTGVKEWDKRFGGDFYDYLTSVQQTTDGGYILGGYSRSGISGDKTESNLGYSDYWVVKISSTGVKEWDKRFGGAGDDILNAVRQTGDGGYILGGHSNSGISGDKTEASQGSSDYWVVKVSSAGVKEWDKRFGGGGYDALSSVQQTTDGGYILGGNSSSGISGDKTEASQGSADYWVVKISNMGVLEWDKRFGGSASEFLYAVQQTTDGGYILGGNSSSGISGDKTEASQGSNDYWIVKISSTGVMEWDKRFGGSSGEGLASVRQTTDGGYILAGMSASGISGDKTETSRGSGDYWLVKTNASGVKEWDKRYGTSDNEELYDILQTTDGGYILGGSTQGGVDGDKTQASQGDRDYWVVKMNFITPPGKALNFDGVDDYVDLSSSIDLTGSSFTLESWFNISNGLPGGNRLITVGGGGGLYNAAGIYVTTTGEISYFFYYDDASYTNASIANDGKWHHVAFTFDHSTKVGKLYLDGQQVHTNTFGAGSGLVGSGMARIGNGIWGGSEFFRGSVDEVRIWNTVRTASEIQANMDNSLSSGTGLVASYNFDKGTPGGINTGLTTLSDASSNGYDGTLTNFALTTGSTSNWVESYAMVVPTASAATGITGTGFTASWSAPSVGTVDNGYRLDVSTSSSFSSFVSGYNGLSVSGTSQAVTGLNPSTTYYYRVRADKTSVTGQGAYSSTITAATTVASSNADLSALTISSGTLSPAFASATTSYSATATAVSSITVTPTTSDATAAIQVRKGSGSYSTVTSGSPSSAITLDAGNNTIEVKVTAENGTTLKTYYISVNRPVARFYVKTASSGTGDGSSWANASADLQAMMNNGVWGDDVWVSAGTYFPEKDYSGNASPADDRTKTFVLKQGVFVYGGFAGTETLLTQRNIASNATILSGDLGINGDASDNSYHVITTNGLTYCLIDGLTIQGGNANGTGSVAYGAFSVDKTNGGGIYNNLGCPSMNNMTFQNNSCSNLGGAIYCASGTWCYLTDSKFLGNSTTAANGSGVAYGSYTSYQITRCTFDGNSGGCIFGYPYSNLLVYRSVFVNNTGSQYGGCLRLQTSGATVENSVFANNSATSSGGAIYVNDFNNESSATIKGCTFYGNSAPTAGNAIWGDNTHIYNSIFSDNPGSLSTVHGASGPSSVNYSLIPSSEVVSATSNNLVSGSPNFVSTTDLDGADNTWRTADDGLMIGFASPAFNGGSSTNATTVDIVGTARPQFTIIDLGAYESPQNLGSTNADLSDLIISAGTLTPVFASATTSYAATVGTISTITVTPTKADANATIQVRINSGTYATVVSGNASSALQLIAGSNTIDVKVTAQDGTTIKTYTVTVTRPAVNRYVMTTSAGAADGTSWANASSDLQAMMNACISGEEVWVASGTYLPTRDYSGSLVPGDNRTKTFTLKNGVKVYGGFAGTETLLTERNVATNITILSGDLGTTGVNTDNAYHVIIGLNLGSATLIDGFTVKDGNANTGGSSTYGGQPFYKNGGGGIYNYTSTYTISNMIFQNNIATGQGGAILNGDDNGALPTVTINDCKFISNTGGSGGGVYTARSFYNMNRCIFDGNTGGGIAAFPFGYQTIDRCVFVNNTTAGNGGAASMRKATLTVTNCVFANNSASFAGGAIFIMNENNESNATIKNSTFYGNTAVTAGNAFWGPSTPIYNCIFENNTGTTYTIHGANGSSSVYYSLISSSAITNAGVTSLVSGTANFVNTTDLDGPDNIWATSDDGLALGWGTAAFNSGWNAQATAFDIVGVARPQLTTVDLGAYESPTIPNNVPAFTATSPQSWAICEDAAATSIVSMLHVSDVNTGQTLTWTEHSAPSHGTITISGATASTGTTNIAPGGTITYTPDASYSGNDTFTIRVSDATSAADMQVNVTVNPLPVVTVPADYAICAGASTTLSGGGADTYVWNNSVTNAVAFTPASTATYTVTGTITATGCENTASVEVTVNPLPNVHAGSDATICIYDSTLITATGNADTYVWNNAMSNGSYVLPTDTTAYIVTGTITATGCQKNDTVVVNVNQLPVVGAGIDQSVCYNASVTLSGSGASTYIWNNSITNNIAFNALATTQYTVQGTDVNGCKNTDSVVVTVNALQPAAFTASTSTVYTGQNSIVYTVPNDPLVNSYTWTITGTGATGTGSTTNSETFSLSTAASLGNRTVSVVSHTTTPACTSPARTMTVNVQDMMPWTGAVDNDWNTAANWTGNFVPYSTIGVTIPVTANDPLVSGVASATVRDVTVNNGAELTMDAGTKLNVVRNIVVNGNVSGNYLVAAGSLLQNISGNGTVANLEMNNASGATISSGNLSISETYLPTNGVLYTNGGLTLLSTAAGTASVLAPGALCSANYIDGEVTVQKWFPGGRRAFRFIAHPFNEWKPLTILTDDIDITGNGGATNGFTTTGSNNPSSFFFNTWIASNDATNDVTGWIPFHTTNGFGTASWDRGEGMRILIRGEKGEGLIDGQAYTPSPVTIDMPGSLNQCDVSYFLHDNGNIGVTGYNLKGNPYPCNIDMVQAVRGDSVGSTFSVWDPWQGTRGAYVTGSFELMPSYILPAYSSFFITFNGDTNGVDNIITFTESMKTGDAADAALFKTTASSIGTDVVQLRVVTDNGTQSWDRLLIYFRNQASPQYDALDGKKFVNPVVNFFSITDTTNFALDTRPLVVNSTIPLGFTTTEEQQYTIQVDDYDINGTQLYLIDKFLNQATPLAQGTQYDFTVTSNPLTQGVNRFEIGVGTTTSVEQVKNGDMNLSIVPNPADDFVTISFDALKKGNTVISIKNLLGQGVYHNDFGAMQSGSVTVPVKELAAGTYLVTVSCGDQVITQRLIKK